MKGFFSKNDIVGETDNCQKCGLYKTCLSPRMNYSGEGKKEILIIAEAPGKTEDEKGKQLVGETGELLKENLSKFRINLDKDCWKINAVNCRPPKNRKPTLVEIKQCKPRVLEVIKKLKPKFIWLMGGVAVESFYLNEFSDKSITRWRGRCIPDYDAMAWILPMYHPSFILRNQDEKLAMVFRSDLKYAVSNLQRQSVREIFLTETMGTDCNSIQSLMEKDVMIVDDIYVINDILQKCKNQTIAFDYETNGINPYKSEDSDIIYASISNGVYAYAFRMVDKIRDSWIQFLTNPSIKKVAHNLKFEDKWGRVCFGVETKGWIWDTMVAQHILDGRKKATGLKFQAYVRYGLKNYDSDISKNSFDWSKIDLRKAMTYCGLDSLITHKLYIDQKKEFAVDKHLQKGNELFFKGTLALADVEDNGICVNLDYYKRNNEKLAKEIEIKKQWLLNSNEAKQFSGKYLKQIDLKSNTDLPKLFYNILNYPAKKTEKGNDSVDSSILTEIDTEFTYNLLEYRKLLKIKDTYLAQFLRETCKDEKLHPSFNLNLVTTYRSSSDSPNFQNIPVRDEYAKQITRSGIIPSKGNQLLEVDYGSLEVRIIACYTLDKVLMDYLISGGDMHTDEAKALFIFTDKEWSKLDPKNAKEIRFYTKNQKVFPYFYGSYYKGCAGNVWPLIDQLKLRDHLKRNGIVTFEDFEEHCRQDENRFWSRFNGVKQWHKKVEKDYMSFGYIEYLTGFKTSGYLTRNDLLNYPIQGAAFHCLLWSLIELNKELKKYKTKIIGQIHDSIVFDLYPPEKRVVFNLCKGIMTNRIRKYLPWIVVPLEIEMEITEIDGCWTGKEAVKIAN